MIGALGGPVTAGVGALIGLVVGLVIDLGILIAQNWDAISAWVSAKWEGVVSWWDGTVAPFFSGLGTWFGGVIGMVTVAFGTGLGVWSYLSLPIVDTFPFSVGTNLRTDVVCTDCMDEATTVIYKNLETEEMVEFGLSDTTWYDTSKWEYVATRVAFDALEEGADEDDFAIYDGADNVASEIIDYEGTTMILFNYDELTISNDNFTDVDKVYRMPAKTREKILRADRGVITIRDGVIVSKEAL